MPVLSRRDFLRASAATALAAPSWSAAFPSRQVASADSVILLMLTGGPSQLDTWDPKPGAPSDIRSPFAAIPTSVPGIRVTELFPKLATMANRIAFVRSVHHTDSPIHAVGFQWINAGKLFRNGPESPSIASQCAASLPAMRVVSSSRRVDTGLEASHGQGTSSKLRFQSNSFEGRCSEAVEMVSKGPAFITINQFDTVFDAPSWDCHAAGGNLDCDLNDYRETVAPQFDRAYSGLLKRLEERGLLERTLVVATGEFGRTPKFNCNGGRDHWTGVWTALFAGGGVKGGRVIGSSDEFGAEPKDRPVHAGEIPATMRRALGLKGEKAIGEVF